MIGIYKFHWDCGRQGSVDGCFVADDSEVEKAIGKEVYFGEILGKHSEIYGTLEESDIELSTTDPEEVELFEAFELASGYNPLEYISEEDSEEDSE